MDDNKFDVFVTRMTTADSNNRRHFLRQAAAAAIGAVVIASPLASTTEAKKKKRKKSNKAKGKGKTQTLGSQSYEVCHCQGQGQSINCMTQNLGSQNAVDAHLRNHEADYAGPCHEEHDYCEESPCDPECTCTNNADGRTCDCPVQCIAKGKTCIPEDNEEYAYVLPCCPDLECAEDGKKGDKPVFACIPPEKNLGDNCTGKYDRCKAGLICPYETCIEDCSNQACTVDGYTACCNGFVCVPNGMYDNNGTCQINYGSAS